MINTQTARKFRDPDVIADDGGQSETRHFKDKQMIAGDEKILFRGCAKLREMQFDIMPNKEPIWRDEGTGDVKPAPPFACRRNAQSETAPVPASRSCHRM